MSYGHSSSALRQCATLVPGPALEFSEAATLSIRSRFALSNRKVMNCSLCCLQVSSLFHMCWHAPHSILEVWAAVAHGMRRQMVHSSK